ncbi:MAG: TRAP transporter permease DctM/Q, partial [Akkermansiaceae bacterium]|nr:TRAP transporter permease DctM/Q [Akkermansiaceae bacterium]
MGAQLYLLFFPQPPMVGRPVHLGFALLLFLLGTSPGGHSLRRVIDPILAVGVVTVLLYYAFSWSRLNSRMEAVDPVLV